jgi:hypothetical protein
MELIVPLTELRNSGVRPRHRRIRRSVEHLGNWAVISRILNIIGGRAIWCLASKLTLLCSSSVKYLQIDCYRYRKVDTECLTAVLYSVGPSTTELQSCRNFTSSNSFVVLGWNLEPVEIWTGYLRNASGESSVSLRVCLLPNTHAFTDRYTLKGVQQLVMSHSCTAEYTRRRLHGIFKIYARKADGEGRI